MLPDLSDRTYRSDDAAEPIRAMMPPAPACLPASVGMPHLTTSCEATAKEIPGICRHAASDHILRSYSGRNIGNDCLGGSAWTYGPIEMIDQSRWPYISIADPIGAMMLPDLSERRCSRTYRSDDAAEPIRAVMPPAASGLPPGIYRHAASDHILRSYS